VSGCKRTPPRQDVGVVPTAVAVDQRTRTVYVANFTERTRGTGVSVVGAARCNAASTSGCTRFPNLPPEIPLPFQPNDLAVDEQTNTIYVDGTGTDLAVIDGRTCNASDIKGCRRRPYIAHVPKGAGAVAVNPKTHTVYVLDYFSALVSVIDESRCNARVKVGCNRVLATVRVGRHPWRMVADVATDTLYVSNFGAGSVSVINGARCNATTVAGCHGRPAVIHVGHEPEGIAVDDANHLAFVTNAGDRSVSIFDTTSCDGANTAGCGRRLAIRRVGNMPDGIAVNERTATVYVADNAGSTLAMFRAALPAGH
jgi:YVTN family beta-propeller protein